MPRVPMMPQHCCVGRLDVLPAYRAHHKPIGFTFDVGKPDGPGWPDWPGSCQFFRLFNLIGPGQGYPIPAFFTTGGEDEPGIIKHIEGAAEGCERDYFGHGVGGSFPIASQTRYRPCASSRQPEPRRLLPGIEWTEPIFHPAGAGSRN